MGSAITSYISLSVRGSELIILTRTADNVEELQKLLKKYGVEMSIIGVSRCG